MLFSKAAYERDYQRAVHRLTTSHPPHCGQTDVAHAMAARSYLLDCMREIVFESVRAEVVPDAPSRRDCLFVVEESAPIELCAARYGFTPGERTVVELESLGESRLFRGQASMLDTSPIVGDIVAAAHRYWAGAGASVPVDDVEILMTGPFRISGVREKGSAPSVYIDGKGLAELFGK